MKKLMRLELERFSLKPHLIGLLIANVAILVLCVFVSTFITALGEGMATAGLPGIALTTVSLSTMLVRAALIVWQGVLVAKLILICTVMLLFHILSSVFQNVVVYLISRQVDFVTYAFESIAMQLIIIISTILLSLVPLAVGMINKSTSATVVSSVVIVAFSSNSQGSTAGLLSIPVIALVMGIVSLAVTSVTVKKMLTSDLHF